VRSTAKLANSSLRSVLFILSFHERKCPDSTVVISACLETMRDLYESSAAVQSLRVQYDWSAIMTARCAIPAASGAFTLLPITMASMKFPVCARSRSCVESNWVAAPLLE